MCTSTDHVTETTEYVVLCSTYIITLLTMVYSAPDLFLIKELPHADDEYQGTTQTHKGKCKKSNNVRSY